MNETISKSSSIVPVELEGIRFRYGRSAILRGINLRIDAGEIVALFGANGSGKTTLFSILTGLSQPNEGARRFAGKEVFEVDEPLRAQLSYVAHSPQLFPLLTARENIELYTNLYSRYGAHPLPIEPVIEKVGLAASLDSVVGKFSRGMSQRLALARALSIRPKVLLLDEPFTALDREGHLTLRSILRAEKERGTAIFFASHDLAVIDDLADRVLCLRDGVIQTTLSRDSKSNFSHQIWQAFDSPCARI